MEWTCFKTPKGGYNPNTSKMIMKSIMYKKALGSYKVFNSLNIQDCSSNKQPLHLKNDININPKIRRKSIYNLKKSIPNNEYFFVRKGNINILRAFKRNKEKANEKLMRKLNQGKVRLNFTENNPFSHDTKIIRKCLRETDALMRSHSFNRRFKMNNDTFCLLAKESSDDQKHNIKEITSDNLKISKKRLLERSFRGIQFQSSNIGKNESKKTWFKISRKSTPNIKFKGSLCGGAKRNADDEFCAWNGDSNYDNYFSDSF